MFSTFIGKDKSVNEIKSSVEDTSNDVNVILETFEVRLNRVFSAENCF